MSGSLYLGCGSAADEEPLWRSMLHRPVTRIVYWPFALPSELCCQADQWLLDEVQRHAFVQPVRDFWNAGGDSYGGSAGAVLACDSIDIADGLDPHDCGCRTSDRSACCPA